MKTVLSCTCVLLAIFIWTGASELSPASAVPRCEYYSPYACKAKKERACGKVGIWTEGVRGSARVFAKGVPCRTARKVIKGSSSGTGTGGWKSVTGSGEGSLYVRRGVKYRGAKLRYKKYIRSSNVLRRSRTSALRSRAVSKATFRKINKSVRRWSKSFYCPQRATTRVSSRKGNWAVTRAINNCGSGSGLYHLFLRRKGGKWKVMPNLTTVGRAYSNPPCTKRVVPADIRCRINW